MQDGLHTEQIAIDDLMPHPANVRQGDVGAISESLRVHGQYRPIVVQRNTRHILAGNHTWRAAKALGWKHIAATILDVDDDQALRILLVDNRSNDIATYDDSGLADLLQQLAATERQLEGTGFDLDDLDLLLSDLGDFPTAEEPAPASDPQPVCCPNCGFEWHASGTTITPT